MAATKNSSTKPASTPATPASASNVPVITPQAIAAADTADLLNEGTKCSAPVKAIGMNCPLPLRFKSAADAIAAYKKKKEELSAMEATLNGATCVFVTEEGNVLFGFETKKRLDTELPWLELRSLNGAVFGYVDPEELVGLEKTGEDLDAATVSVHTDGVQLSITMTEMASVKNDCRGRGKDLDRFNVFSTYADAFESLVKTPFEETDELVELIAKAVEEMASKFGRK